jgi:tripartite-type tricarboxylate transporter receptor subunit TctC
LAAREQAQGIEHVSVAIEQMSKVAQDTADSASQIAHAAEQTLSQAMSVEDLVEQGIQVVGFSIRRQDRVPSTRPTPKITPLKQRSERINASAATHHRAHAQNHLAYGDKPQLHAPEPTSEQHFKDF